MFCHKVLSTQKKTLKSLYFVIIIKIGTHNNFNALISFLLSKIVYFTVLGGIIGFNW